MPDYGSLEESAKKLLKHAEEKVRRGHDLDTLHLIYAALDHPTAEMPGCQLFANLIEKDKQANKQAWVNVLEYELEVLHGEAVASIDRTTDGLGKCIRAWKEEAKQRKVAITDMLILQTIISRDDPIIKMMTYFVMPIIEIKSALDAQIADKHRTIGDEDDEARKEARQLLKLVKPEQHIRPDMHGLSMTSFLDGLAQCVDSEDGAIAILTGQHGSPVETLDQVLAARLIAKETFIGHLAFLNDCKGIELLNLATVYGLAHVPGKPEPAKVLEMAKQETVNNQTILMLEHIETLAQHHTDTINALREVLLDRGKALIVGLHVATQEEGQGALPDLGLANIVRIEIHGYTLDRTKTFLQKYYRPDWAEQGFLFTSDAFDLLCQLAPGAWVYQKHRVLPYLVVDVGHATVQAALRGESLIQETAQDTLEALKRLAEEWARATEPKRKPFEDALGQAEAEIKKLASGASPALPPSEKKTLLTRAHVLAQFLCPSGESEFHYPGQEPEQLKHQHRSHSKSSH